MLPAVAVAVPSSAARSRRTVLVLAALWTLTGGAYGCVLPFLTVYAAGRGLTLTGIGVLGACGAGASALIQPAVGRLVDRTGRGRTIVLGGTLLGAAGFTGLGQVRAAPLIVVFAMLGVSAFYGSRVVITAATVDHVARAGHGAAMYARFRVCPAIGFTVAAVLGGLLLGRITFAELFTVGALLYLLAGLCVMALPARTDPQGSNLLGTRAQPTPAISPRRVLIALSLMSLLFYAVGSTSDTYVPLLMRGLHGSFEAVGLVGTVSALLEIPLMIIIGGRVDRGSSALILALGLTAVPLRYALYLVVHTPAQLIAVQCLDAVSFSVYAIAGVTLLATLTPPSERAWALGVFSAAGTLGPIAGPLLAGVVAARVGIQPMLGLVTVVALAVPLAVTAGLWPLLARHRHD
ncbi:MAG TPA: MFS transporter [Chloroflexota bacterium]|nr:MFS transporter [Chloroflexota bacterium]